MKIKDLDENKSLANVRFIYPGDGQKYYWRSQWAKGVWGKKNIGDSRIIPLFVDDLKDTLEWEVVDDSN
jgi:hypothetical protein